MGCSVSLCAAMTVAYCRAISREASIAAFACDDLLRLLIMLYPFWPVAFEVFGAWVAHHPYIYCGK
jgi:hypothetical protein